MNQAGTTVEGQSERENSVFLTSGAIGTQSWRGISSAPLRIGVLRASSLEITPCLSSRSSRGHKSLGNLDLAQSLLHFHRSTRVSITRHFPACPPAISSWKRFIIRNETGNSIASSFRHRRENRTF